MECEVHIRKSVPPLSYELIKIQFEDVKNFDTAVASYGFDARTEVDKWRNESIAS